MGDRTGISLLVRNVSRRLRPEDVRKEFERFGDVRDVYIPKDYYTREAKGFAFVEFKNERDANDARQGLDGVRIDGREIRVVFAQERRKTTDQMRDREKTDGITDW
uniref:RRM domain-containing protein n=1 Tax=Globisporangium ultimum (strain ATCC 200006 / CBS 805.95 / DAOM BR144) TaxID=431595 RepID=K3WQC2_GLOUD